MNLANYLTLLRKKLTNGKIEVLISEISNQTTEVASRINKFYSRIDEISSRTDELIDAIKKR